MDKSTWIKTCRFTAHASGKPHLSKKERIDLMQAQIAIGIAREPVKVVKAAWKPAPAQVQAVSSIKDILAKFNPTPER